MRSFLCADFLICSIVFLAVFFECTKADIEQGKNRRGGGTSGLFAFPRVGRSDPNLLNNLHENGEAAAFEALAYPNSLEDYEEYPKSEIKRASLIAFPRVGKADAEIRKWAHLLALQQALDKRNGPSATSGLWFGPRLGKRSIDEQHQQQHDKQPGAAVKGQKEQF